MTSSASIPNRWAEGKWKTEERFQYFLVAIEELIDKISGREIQADYFTPHDSSHCIAVEKMAKAIIIKIFPEIGLDKCKLTELEKFILFAAVWTHDIGMIESVAQEYLKEDYCSKTKREKHEYISSMYIFCDKEFEEIFTGKKRNKISESLFKSYVEAISIIIKYHRRKFNIEDCPEFLYIKDQKIRSRLIACLLRLADTLHVDSSRYSRKLFDILQIGNFDRTARLHWLKSYVVSSVYFDITKQVIVVSVNLPEFKNEKDDLKNKYEKRRVEENAERLKFIIKENIQEDLVAVKEIFKEYELRFFESVDVRVNYCPGYQDEKRNEILGILDDLDIVMSPNTSKVIRKALDSIRALTEMKFNTYEHFQNQAHQLIQHLNDVKKARPCHVGLLKIVDSLTASLERSTPDDKVSDIKKSKIDICRKVFREEIEKIEAIRKEAKGKIHEKTSIFFKNKKYIFLFGFSELVIEFIEHAKLKELLEKDTHFYVFECAGKRMFSVMNSMEYNDGFHYAINLSRKGFKNIELMPDASFASLLSCLEYNVDLSKRSCVLFGANGVDKNTKDCGHTSGHLMMAIVAKQYHVPVYIIADSFKIGDIKWNPNLVRDEASWLVGQKSYLDELKNNKITVKNYREDRILREYITGYISDVDIDINPDEPLDIEYPTTI